MAWKQPPNATVGGLDEQEPLYDPMSNAGRAMWDTPVWWEPVRPERVALANVPDPEARAMPTKENMTRWTPFGPNGQVEALPSRPQNATLAFTGAGLWRASLGAQTDWDHMAVGGTVELAGQQIYASLQANSTVEFYPSTIYRPAPSFGSVAPPVL